MFLKASDYAGNCYTTKSQNRLFFKMLIETFLNKLTSSPETIEFTELMDLIEHEYQFTDTAFDNGDLHNKLGENSGSCKLFSFAKLHELSKENTLACFGRYYREDVLQHPNKDNHQNIRNFMQTGWEGIRFSGNALVKR